MASNPSVSVVSSALAGLILIAAALVALLQRSPEPAEAAEAPVQNLPVSGVRRVRTTTEPPLMSARSNAPAAPSHLAAHDILRPSFHGDTARPPAPRVAAVAAAAPVPAPRAVSGPAAEEVPVPLARPANLAAAHARAAARARRKPPEAPALFADLAQPSRENGAD